MTKWDRWHSAHILDHPTNALKTFNMSIIPNSSAAGTRLTIGQKRILFEENKTNFPGGAVPREHDMIVANMAIQHAIYGHKRYHNAILQRDTFKIKRAE